MNSAQSVNAPVNGSVNRHLVFSLGSEEYSVPLLKVKEVIEIPEITPVPHTPPYYRGIMNLRGQVISIIDLKYKLKGIEQEMGKKTAVIIMDFDSFCIGVAVSSVNRVMALPDADIKQPPVMESSDNLDYVTGITHRDKKLILLLDISKALHVEDLNLIHARKTAAQIA